MEYNISQLDQIVGVSARTLRYYDQIDLLKPLLYVNEAGYRFYGEDHLLELEQRQQQSTDLIKNETECSAQYKNILSKKCRTLVISLGHMKMKKALLTNYYRSIELFNLKKIIIILLLFLFLV